MKKKAAKNTKNSRKNKAGPWTLRRNKMPKRIRGVFSLVRRWGGDTITAKGHDIATPSWNDIESPGCCVRLIAGKLCQTFTGARSIEMSWLWDREGPYPSEAGLRIVLGREVHYERNDGNGNTEYVTKARKDRELVIQELPTPSDWLKTMVVYLRTDDSAIVVASNYTPEELNQKLTRHVTASVVDSTGHPFLLDYLGYDPLPSVEVKTTDLPAFLAKAMK
jgi:hypothetical protein